MGELTQEALKEMEAEKEFFIGIDSDGCAFDTMEIKHKECFIPNIIKHWELQPISKYAREAAEFVNLYSKWRGINRFPALIMVFDLLKERDEVAKRNVSIPEAKSLREWIKTESKLGNPALKAVVEKTNDPVLTQALRWSEAVNRTVADMVKGIPPFPFLRESLQKAQDSTDMIVVSATPNEALQREWEEHNIAQYVRAICGQELGKKNEHIALAAGGKYKKEHMLMVGDAPGDMKAAKANGALFYPINPGREDESWERFYKEAMDRFLNGEYAGSYEEKLIEEFEKYLPDIPPWKRG
ncbi:MAG TPA: HAD family hydrolase [Candidatus Omnitrophica bacterium]|nr:HAD family hydrolase [Candidatus Omnitrophota bacterium]